MEQKPHQNPNSPFYKMDKILFTREQGRVILNMPEADWEKLLMFLGYCTGLAHAKNKALAHSVLEFTNHLNEGNPNWTPYVGGRDASPDR